MSAGTVIGSLAVALGVGAAMGGGFCFLTADSRLKLKRDISLGVLFAVIGWIAGMILPIIYYKNIAAVFLAMIVCGVSLHAYWAIFKERTNLSKNFDADSPNQFVRDQARPT